MLPGKGKAGRWVSFEPDLTDLRGRLADMVLSSAGGQGADRDGSLPGPRRAGRTDLDGPGRKGTVPGKWVLRRSSDAGCGLVGPCGCPALRLRKHPQRSLRHMCRLGRERLHGVLCEPAVRAGAAGLQGRRPGPAHQGIPVGSARTSRRLRASRPQTTATRWTGPSRSRYLSA